MKRIIIIGTAICALAGATVAQAATLNNYTANINFSTTKSGTPSKPVSIGYTQNLTAANAAAGFRAAPLVDIKTTIFGLRSNLSKFPTCSFKTIETGPKFDKACPKGSLVATGSVKSLLGGPDLSVGGGPCNPGLNVYNAGGGKEWYFFTAAGTQCGTLHTGDTQPYPGYVKQQGKNLVIDVPLPSYVSTAVAHHNDLYGSLINQSLTVKPASIKVNGKTYGSTEAVGCKAGKRNWSVAFTAVPKAGAPGVTQMVSGSSKC